MSKPHYLVSNSAIIASALTVAVLAVTTAAPAHAYQCKTYPTQAHAIAKSKMRASVKARRAWPGVVKSQLGQAWSVWQIAKGKTEHCSRITISSGKKRWRCIAIAKPCLYVVE